VLNCQPHDVPILVAARLLKPLGNPPPNSVKLFAAFTALACTGHLNIAQRLIMRDCTTFPGS
jgi:hypothetical protein